MRDKKGFTAGPSPGTSRATLGKSVFWPSARKEGAFPHHRSSLIPTDVVGI